MPAEDAEVVRRLEAAGAIVLAEADAPEFAYGANTNNVFVPSDPRSVRSAFGPRVLRVGSGHHDRHRADGARH